MELLLGNYFSIGSLLLGGFITIFVFFKFSPILNLQVTFSWADAKQEHLIVKYQIENFSNVRLKNPIISTQFLCYKLDNYSELSEYVPFKEENIIEKEFPIEWKKPKQILRHTKRIYPREVMNTERYYHITQNDIAIHIALQAKVKLSLIGKILTRKKGDWSQTRTVFIIKHT